jgi:hypothetical protein
MCGQTYSIKPGAVGGGRGRGVRITREARAHAPRCSRPASSTARTRCTMASAAMRSCLAAITVCDTSDISTLVPGLASGGTRGHSKDADEHTQRDGRGRACAHTRARGGRHAAQHTQRRGAEKPAQACRRATAPAHPCHRPARSRGGPQSTTHNPRGTTHRAEALRADAGSCSPTPPFR